MGIKNIIKKCVPTSIKREIKYVYFKRKRLSVAQDNNQLRMEMFDGVKGRENEIPLFIISYNRLSYLKELIKRLEEMKITNIIIVDNKSSYQPLLDYYKSIPYKVVYEEENLGHRVIWKDDSLKEYRKNFYMVTDSDVVPSKECPTNFISVWVDILKKYPNLKKVGFSLRIDDLPGNKMRKNVIKWEKFFFKKFIKEDNCYLADIDTTFALYLPDQLSEKTNFFSAMRTAKPIEAIHLPWYKDINELTDEDLFYENSKLACVGEWDLVNQKNRGHF